MENEKHLRGIIEIEEDKIRLYERELQKAKITKELAERALKGLFDE